jgi:dihydrofolate reductase
MYSRKKEQGMRIVVSEFVSLDGVMEAPEKWVFRFSEKEIDAFKLDEVLEASALLLGATTYQGFAESWPSRSDPNGFADKMNSMPKYVVSTASEKLAWNNSHQVKGNIAEEIVRLKQQPGHMLLVAGSGVLVQALMQHDLVDEYRLLVYPLVLGKGKRLFQEGSQARLKLEKTQAFSTGVVLLQYQPERK